MARTHRTIHVSPTARAKRGGKQETPDETKRTIKSNKQRRPNEKAALRKEYFYG